MALLNPPSISKRAPRGTVVSSVSLDSLTALSTTTLLLIVTTLVGAVIRLWDLGSQSLWNDEIISVRIAEHSFGEIVRARLRIEASDGLIDELYTNYPPFHVFVLHIVNAVSPGDVAYRLPFALAGIATIPLTYQLVRRLFSERVALPSAIALAVSPMHIAYSQEARPSIFLVLFSLIAIIALLDAMETNQRSSWALFAVASILNIWNSYFALILFMPMAALYCGLLLLQLAREDRAALPSRFVHAAIAFAAVGASALPLISDLLATSDMNSAAVESSAGPLRAIASLGVLMQMAIPIPLDPLAGVATLVAILIGLVVIARRRDMNAALIFLWVAAPLGILGAIQSDHIIELRYIMFLLPFAVAIALEGVFTTLGLLHRLLPRTSPTVLANAVMTVLVVASVFGSTKTVESADAGHPVKVDWESVAREYARGATDQSCLVVIDGTGHGMYGIVQHYLDDLEGDYCAIDGRDPALLATVESHDDLWWAISNQWYPDRFIAALTTEFSRDSHVSSYFLVQLFHPNAVDAALTPSQRAESFLRRAISAAEPVGSTNASRLPGIRESLANLFILRCGVNVPAQTIVSLLDGYLEVRRINNDLAWGRAEGRLDRGELDAARALGIRLIGLSAGNPAVYTYMADVQRAAGSETAAGYAAAAAALHTDLVAEDSGTFPSC